MKPDKPDEGPTTTIGSTIIIRGKLRSDEDLVVEGRIEAEIVSSKALIIENSGIVKANVQVKSARVSGVVVGNIAAEAKVELASDGRVVGDIMSPKIVIRDGAAFRGRIDMPDFDAPRASASDAFVSTPMSKPILVEEPVPMVAMEAMEPPAVIPDATPVPPETPWVPADQTPAQPFPALTQAETSVDNVFDEPYVGSSMPPPKPPIPAERDSRQQFKRKRF